MTFLNWHVVLRGRDSLHAGDGAEAKELEVGLGEGTGLGEVDEEVEGPVVMGFGIDEGLLDEPSLFVFGGFDVGVAEVAGFVVEEEALVVFVVIDHEAFEAGSGPGLAVGVVEVVEILESGFAIA